MESTDDRGIAETNSTRVLVDDQAGPSRETEKGKEGHVNELARLIGLRRYSELCDLVDSLIEEYGWRDVVRQIRKIPLRALDAKRDYFMAFYEAPSSIISLRRGVLRDGTLSILGLEHITGMDGDLSKSFGRMNAQSLHDLREKVVPKAVQRLKRQVKRGTTFFIDTRALSGTPFESLAPLVTKQRKGELLTLGDGPSWSRFAGTYYGFSKLTGMSSHLDIALLEEDLEAPIEVSGKRPCYQKTIFHHCSDDLARLLVNCLRLAQARPQTQNKGAIALGALGDSRALSLLHSVFKRKSPSNPLLYRVMWALGEIGHPSSLEHLTPYLGNFTFDRDAMSAISTLRHPSAVDVLLERAFNRPRRRPKGYWRNTSEKELTTRGTATLWLARTCDKRAVGPLSELLQDRETSSSALHSLLSLSGAGHQAIRENMPIVSDAVVHHNSPDRVMKRFLELIPDLAGSNEFFDLVSRLGLRCGGFLKKYPEFLEHQKVRESILKAMEFTSYPFRTIRDVHRLGLLKDDEFKDMAMKRATYISGRIRKRGKNGSKLLSTYAICSVPLLYEADEVQEAVASVIRCGERPESVVSTLKDHEVLSRSPTIQEAVIDRLSSYDSPIWFLENVIQSPGLMSNSEVQTTLSEALLSFWSSEQNARIRVNIDWDTNEFLWVFYIRPLFDYPKMGRLERFQRAMATLLLNTDYPSGVLKYFHHFPGLLESRAAEEAIAHLISTTSSSLDLNYLLRHLPEMYQATTKDKIERMRQEESLRRQCVSDHDDYDRYGYYGEDYY
ncbi:MAG: HEAT repeat domain-containing protein [Candidatus Thorarchaeota archaeon]